MSQLAASAVVTAWSFAARPAMSEIKLVFSIPPHRPTPNFAPNWNAVPPAAARLPRGACDRWPHWEQDPFNGSSTGCHQGRAGSRSA